MKSTLRTLWNDLLNFFFPEVCLLCGKLLYQGEEHICLHCYCRLPKTGFYKQISNPAWQLFLGKVHIEKAWAYLYFEKGSAVQKLVHAFKYHNRKKLAWWLGKLAAEEITRHPDAHTFDVLVPVPLHPSAQRKRGYNQTEWIAQGVHTVTGLPVQTGRLIKKTPTTSQTRHTVYDRWKNIKQAFAVEHSEELEGKHILLIDDVLTTGSTTTACAEVLLAIPGTRVSILALTIA